MGTGATVAYANHLGVTGQTIGAGAFNVLRDKRLFALVAINLGLTAGETQRLTAFLKRKAGGYAP